MPAKKDYSGMKFGKLKAIRHIEGTRWEFACECGERTIRMIQSVTSAKNKGNVSSCQKCRKKSKPPRVEPYRIEITGQKFGKLTAIDVTGETSKRRYAIWIFRCDCGKEVKRTASVVVQMAKRGQVPNCGSRTCSGHYKMPDMEAALRECYRAYQRGAILRGLEWTLTAEEVTCLLSGECYYCGTSSSMTTRARSGGHWIYHHNGIDRIDNDKGYVLGNVVSCCKNCNRAKRDMPYEEFTAWINLLIAYQSKK